MKKKTKLPINIGKYLDPLSDFGFKYLFGSDPNKELLIAFLNELFKGRKTILDLSYNKNESHGPQRRYRNTIYDLTCTGQDGEQFIIEVQRIYQQYFKDRALYYTAALIHDQGPKGQKKWDYKLKEIYLIGLMDFSFDDSRPEVYLHKIHLADEVTGEKFYEKLGYIFIEIPKFNKQENELETKLDRWLYVLKNMSKLQKIPVFLSKRIFQKLFTLAEVSKLTKEEYMKYEKSLMAEWDEYAVLKTVEEKSMKQGIEKGEEKKSYEFVKNLLLQTDFSTAKIASLSNVTVEFVENVRKTLE